MAQLKHPPNALDEYRVDELDIKVLRGYQQDASLPYKDLGELIGLPPSTVFDRIKKLRKVGIIKAIIPIVDPEKLGFGTTAWILAKAAKGSDCCVVSSEIAKMPDVLEVHEIAGPYDIFVKVKAHDNLDLHNISERISNVAGVADAYSTVALCTFKEDIRLNI